MVKEEGEAFEIFDALKAHDKAGCTRVGPVGEKGGLGTNVMLKRLFEAGRGV